MTQAKRGKGPSHSMMLLLHNKKTSLPPEQSSTAARFLKWRQGVEKFALLFAKLSWKHALAAVLMAVLMGILLYNKASDDKTATLRVTGQHSFRSAQLTIWIDQERVYQGKISGSAKRHFGVFQKNTSVQGSFSQTVMVASGSHAVRVKVSTPDGYEHEQTIQTDFSANTEQTLAVSPLRGGVNLSWKEMRVLQASGEPTWYAKYFRTLLMMVSGSAFSALMGMLVQRFIALVKSQLGVQKI
jgi:hypothetical protein